MDVVVIILLVVGFWLTSWDSGQIGKYIDQQTNELDKKLDVIIKQLNERS